MRSFFSSLLSPTNDDDLMHLNGNLRDIFTNRSLRLAIDSIFSIILLFSDRMLIFAAILFQLNNSNTQ